MEQKLSDFEKRDERESYGGGDGRAINRHSVRVYEVKDVRFTLNRTLDGSPPFFNLYFFTPGRFVSTNINVDGKEYWGDGIPWGPAETKAYEAIQEWLYRNTEPEEIKSAFENSPEFKTLVKPGPVNVFFEHDQWWARVDDEYYDCEDPESERTFSVNEAVFADGTEGFSFEE